jgi:L-iditol 2-dehydrogenase
MSIASKMMKAAVWYSNRDIRIEEQPLRRPNSREMLVKVIACGICGSDVVEWYRLPRAPLVQGHELGAEVVETGSDVTGFHAGDRVFIAPKVACLECKYCRGGHYPQCIGIKERLPGAFAEYVLVPETLVNRGTWALPDSISYDQATFIEPLACVVRAQRIAGLQAGQNVLVLGCGMSGLLQVQLAKRKGCRVAVTDVDARKLERAAAFGVDCTIPATGNVPQEVERFFGSKADVVILCTGAVGAIEQAWTSVDKGGAVVFFAVPGPDKTVTIPVNTFWTSEIRVLTSYYCGPPDIEESLRLLAEGAIEVESLVTHHLPLAEIGRGFRLVLEGREAIKVIIEPHPAGE